MLYSFLRLRHRFKWCDIQMKPIAISPMVNDISNSKAVTNNGKYINGYWWGGMNTKGQPQIMLPHTQPIDTSAKDYSNDGRAQIAAPRRFFSAQQCL